MHVRQINLNYPLLLAHLRTGAWNTCARKLRRLQQATADAWVEMNREYRPIP
jgi:hypothetical protein